MKVGRMMVLTVVLVLSGTWASADECNSLRYVNNGDGTITDCRTGLIWLEDANCTYTFNGIDKSNSVLTWHDAMAWVAGLADTGNPNPGHGCWLSDGSFAGEWRLPTITEWRAMIAGAKKLGFSTPTMTNAAGTAQWASGDAFYIVLPSYYWSSTTRVDNANQAWLVYLGNGTVNSSDKTTTALVWPVRGGQSGAFGSLYIE